MIIEIKILSNGGHEPNNAEWVGLVPGKLIMWPSSMKAVGCAKRRNDYPGITVFGMAYVQQ